jgi:hypothetical protein
MMIPDVTVTLDSGQVAATIIATAALVAAVVYLARGLRRVLTIVHAIENVVERELNVAAVGEVPGPDEPLKATVQRELTNNHGSSMKDDLDGLTVGFHALARQVDDLDDRLGVHDERLNAHLAQLLDEETKP